MRRWILGSLVVVIAVADITAQSTSAADTRKVLVSVTDAGGAPVLGLTAADFVVQFDGVDQPVLLAEPAREPLSVVVIADGVDPGSAQPVRAALRLVLASLRQEAPDARVGLTLTEAAFRPRMMSVSGEADVLDRTIARFFETGRASPLFESFMFATEALARETTGRRVVLAMRVKRSWVVLRSNRCVADEPPSICLRFSVSPC
jgi:hypothetical protein